MSINNETLETNHFSHEITPVIFSDNSEEIVLEDSQKETKCFVDFFNNFEEENHIDLKIEALNLQDEVNQSNIYWKPKRKQPKFIHQFYLLGDTIGRGSYGKVKDSIDIRTLKRYAIKIVCKMNIKKIIGGMKHVESEIKLMKTLNHPNVIKLVDNFMEADPERRCLVMEFCLGSIHDLQTNGILESSNQFRCLPEWQAHNYFVQIIEGVDYLHSQRLIHKDLKPGNFLLTEHEIVKITDFGVSEKFDLFHPNSFITGGQTTPAIQPPELAGGGTKICGYKLDVYGVGVSLYFMLCGRVPFNNANILLIFDEIASGVYSIPDSLSEAAANLIRSMMLKNVKERFSMWQVRYHRWFKDGSEKSGDKVDPHLYLSYGMRDTTKQSLYPLCRRMVDSQPADLDLLDHDCGSGSDDGFPIGNGGALLGLSIEEEDAIMPLTVTTRLRTYYNWPLTLAEERLLVDEQFILADDFGGAGSAGIDSGGMLVDENMFIDLHHSVPADGTENEDNDIMEPRSIRFFINDSHALADTTEIGMRSLSSGVQMGNVLLDASCNEIVLVPTVVECSSLPREHQSTINCSMAQSHSHSGGLAQPRVCCLQNSSVSFDQPPHKQPQHHSRSGDTDSAVPSATRNRGSGTAVAKAKSKTRKLTQCHPS